MVVHARRSVAAIVGTSVAFLILKISLRPLRQLLAFLLCLVVSCGLVVWLMVGFRTYLPAKEAFSLRIFWEPVLGVFFASSLPFLLDLSLSRK